MNSLEYIDNDIKTCKRLIKKLEKSIDTYDEVLQGPLDPIDQRFYRPKQDFIDQLNRYKNTLNILKQIKAELEAWYILKEDLEHTENELGEHEIELRKFYTDADVEVEDTKEKYYTLKKALEVKENVD